MSVAAPSVVAIHMESDCFRDGCSSIAQNLLDVLDNGKYRDCSVLKLPVSLAAWQSEHRTARKRVARAERHGYRFEVVKRHEYVDDIYEINTSLKERQGRPMSDGYLQRPSRTPLPAYACGRHAIRTYGVLHGTNLAAYLWLYRAGELALVSSILGHADHLDEGIMYLLVAGALETEISHGQGALVYNRHDSGTDGLRFFKERCGFEERRVEWCP